MVLRIAMTLLHAEKGLLLSTGDADHDKDLDLLASWGFDADPEHSAIAQRFATQVLERDRTIREDEPRLPAGTERTPADDEIQTLVAIPIYILDEFRGVVVCANRPGGFHDLDEEVLLALGGQAGALMHNARLHGRLRKSYLGTIRVLANAMEAKEGSLRDHGDQVARFAAGVAAKLGLDRRSREEVIFGSLLHDIGKVGISERILLKPAPLTLEEFAVVRLHPRIGFRIVEQVPDMEGIARGILHHHERFDGTGYPSGLRGEEIPQEGRIIAVADAFSAMISDRPYRARMPIEQACELLQRFAGTQFDPEIVRIFVDEVNITPPTETPSLIAVALADPEVEVRRAGDEMMLGAAQNALTDSLTQLYAHRYFRDVVAAEVSRATVQGTPFGVMLLELTGIAEINLRDGYAAGDAALKETARMLQGLAVDSGGTACRDGGRRLALVVPHAEEEAVSALANEAVATLAPGVRARAGVAVWRPGETAEDVIGRARLGLTDARSLSSRHSG
jgi:diguanylate cyclase (GGDEF)-like protein